MFTGFAEILAIERAIERHFALAAAAGRADLAVNGGTEPPGPAGLADFAERHVQFSMVRAHLFFKVEIEHDEKESPEKIGEEIARNLRKLYVTRAVELSSVVPEPE
jgi:hypothetical protein